MKNYYSFTADQYSAFILDLTIILTDLKIKSKLTEKLNPEPMKPINKNQEQKINKAFIYIVLFLAFIQIINIIIHI